MVEALLTVVKLLFAVISIPACYSLVVNFSHMLPVLGDLQNVFVWGLVTYPLLHLFFYSPQGVFQTGQKVFGDVFRSVPVLAAIVPLWIPIIPVFILLLSFVVVALFNFLPAQPFFIYFAGFGMAMHLILSAQAEFEEDDNALKPHYLFLISLTLIFNILLLVLLLNLNFSKFSFVEYITTSYQMAKDSYLQIYQQLFVAR